MGSGRILMSLMIGGCCRLMSYLLMRELHVLVRRGVGVLDCEVFIASKIDQRKWDKDTERVDSMAGERDREMKGRNSTWSRI